MITRVYRVFNTTTGDDFLVRAASQAQAIRHVVADQYRANVAGQETIIELLSRGDKVMDAGGEMADEPTKEAA